MRDALLVVDVVNDFRHEDGERLAASFVASAPALRASLDRARAAGVPVVYANDNRGAWDGDREAFVAASIRDGRAGEALAAVAPRPGEAFLFKLRYSAFDFTPLEPLLHELGVERLLLAGTATERCVAQTAIAARERGFKVSVLARACAHVDERDAALALDYLERIVGCRVERG
ncbi:MAG: isochorismatase family cysteine hydrolase [Thermoleophilia bacterium]